ncbi:MAG: AIR carboxylase family protein [Sphaerochaetaceae bacterium]
MKHIAIIMGSQSDRSHADQIIAALTGCTAEITLHVASAHKQPLELLKILSSFATTEKVVFVTIAGRSNALSGFVAANTGFPVIACPPFADRIDMLVNIQSTLQMPSGVPVLTVLDPGNAALAAMRILALAIV